MGEGEGGDTRSSRQTCQVSDFKVLLKGCTAGADKNKFQMSGQLGKEIQFDSEKDISDMLNE